MKSGSIDWDRFYRGLEALVVPIPDPSPGEPVSVAEIRDLLLRVQANRQRLDRVGVKLGQRLASTRRALSVKTEDLRLARVYAGSAAEVRGLRASDRADAVSAMTAVASARLAALRGKLAELEAAARAVDIQTRSLQTSKETLNAVLRALLEPSSPGGSGGAF